MTGTCSYHVIETGVQPRNAGGMGKTRLFCALLKCQTNAVLITQLIQTLLLSTPLLTMDDLYFLGSASSSTVVLRVRESISF